ncbi:hypothetical protein QO199_24555 [Serratia bockelmannii]|uniref:Uncharacterized protein n=1 Tax=Serratia bockelmannii TaxID=2703793 RepID=A0ABT8M0V5_9GAMM|nr:hypothetical protein [Serratia bockelmannii]MDN6881816.1 hypothetical protein [Serratia bockelmannii]HBH6890308.1 hypothetical protein [Serratia marcescens]
MNNETKSLEELAQPVAYAVVSGRYYNDQAFINKTSAQRSRTERNDGSSIAPLYSQAYVDALRERIEEAEIIGIEKLAAAFESWANDSTHIDYEAQRHWATASKEALSFADDLRNRGNGEQ